jgi:F0F1-type ATP synthase membrane subunit b/b'
MVVTDSVPLHIKPAMEEFMTKVKEDTMAAQRRKAEAELLEAREEAQRIQLRRQVEQMQQLKLQNQLLLQQQQLNTLMQIRQMQQQAQVDQFNLFVQSMNSLNFSW